MKPYKDIEVTDKYIIREFNENIDPIVIKVLAKYYERSQLGIEKYGRTLDRDDLSITDWLTHAQEEAMDFVLYLERLKHEYKQFK